MAKDIGGQGTAQSSTQEQFNTYLEWLRVKHPSEYNFIVKTGSTVPIGSDLSSFPYWNEYQTNPSTTDTTWGAYARWVQSQGGTPNYNEYSSQTGDNYKKWVSLGYPEGTSNQTTSTNQPTTGNTTVNSTIPTPTTNTTGQRVVQFSNQPTATTINNTNGSGAGGGTVSDIPVALQGLKGIRKAGKYWVWDDIVNGKILRYTFDDTGELFGDPQDLGKYVPETTAKGDNSWTQVSYQQYLSNGGTKTYDAWVAGGMKLDDTEESKLTPYQEVTQTNWEKEFEWRKQEAERQAILDKEKLLATLSGPRSWIQYWQAKYGNNPATPGFISRYTGLQEGSQLQPTNVATPSGQWLNQNSPSIREGLMGFADWSAQNNKSMTGEDLLNSTKQQLPTDSPFGSRWLPMRK